MTTALQEHVKKPLFEIKADAAKNLFLEVIPDENIWRKEQLYALQILKGNQLLQKCEPESITNALVNVALTGTSLNPVLQWANLVPRKGKCCLDFSYRGLIQLAMKTGSVKSINAFVVYKWDEFSYEEGERTKIIHKPSLNPPEDMDKIIKSPSLIWDYVVCAYSRAILHNGEVDYVVLSKMKLYKTYQSSQGKDNKDMPWNTWPEEMIRKTAIKYHYKTLPQNEQLSRAVSILHEYEGNETEPSKQSRVMERFGVTEGEIIDIQPEPAETVTEQPQPSPSEPTQTEPQQEDEPPVKQYINRINNATTLDELKDIWTAINSELKKKNAPQLTAEESQLLTITKNKKKKEIEAESKLDINETITVMESLQNIDDVFTFWERVEPFLQGEDRVKVMMVRDKKATELRPKEETKTEEL